MRVNFQQGIISYPIVSTIQSFLSRTGSYVSISTAAGLVNAGIAHGNSNYLIIESADVTNAWGPIAASTDTWLYWNIEPLTGARTFGQTLVAPQFGTVRPSGSEGLHWYDVTNKAMYVYSSGVWSQVIRVFACKVNDSTFTGLGSGVTGRPFAGTQVGLSGTEVGVGRILADDSGLGVRRGDGRFLTTEDDFFVNGSPINNIRLESTVLNGEAVTNLAKYNVVKFSQLGGKISAGNYNDLQQNLIAVLLQDLTTGQVGSVVTQGVITNPNWSWPTASAPLWILDGGQFTTTNPHVSDAVTYPTAKSPVARVITATSIFFDQGLGLEPSGSGGGSSATVNPATTTTLGMIKLSTAPADSANPIAVGTNDTRIAGGPFSPSSHTHAATAIVFTPYGTLGTANVQAALQELSDEKVAKAGDSMSNTLTINSGTLIIASGVVGASTPQLLTQTWNDSSIQFVGTDINITNTASAANARLSRWRVGNVEKAAITPSGDVLADGVSVKTLEALHWMGI